MKSEIRTLRLLLRPIEGSDVPGLLPIYSDPVVRKYMTTGPLDNHAAKKRISELIAHQQKYGFSKWALIDPETDVLLGYGGLEILPASGGVEFGVCLARDHWGRGYGTECGHAWVRAAFCDLGFVEILAFAHPANAASIRMLRKIGMTPTGTSARGQLLFKLSTLDTRSGSL